MSNETIQLEANKEYFSEIYDRRQSIVFCKTREAFGGLSNMAGGFLLEVNGIQIRTSEALYQACRFPHRPEVQRLIIEQASPMAAKMKSKPYRDDSRPDWDQLRVNIMRWCLRVKLAQNWITFSELLLETGDCQIVEESYKDAFWGAKRQDEFTLEGANVLGLLLMELRDALKSGDQRLLCVEPLIVDDFLLAGLPIETVIAYGLNNLSAQHNNPLQDCYAYGNVAANDAVDIDLGNLNFDPEAEIEADLIRDERVRKHQIADLGRDPTKPIKGKGPTVLVGFDSEFVPGDKDNDNTILSLQFHVDGECGSYPHVEYPTGKAKSDRPFLSEVMVNLILSAMEAGFIAEWPNQVVVCGFFLRIDLQAFGDLPDFKFEVDNIAGRAASINPLTVKLNDAEVARLLRNKYILVNDPDDVFRSLKIRFVDVGGHVAMGTTLAQIGDLLELPKLELPDGYTKDRMDLLLEGDKQAFEEYGLRDAEIAVRFYKRLQEFAKRETGSTSLPATASSLAVTMFIKQLEADGVNFNVAFGVYESATAYWNAVKGSVVTKTEKNPVPMRGIFEPFVADCYSGGRNECYAFGPTPIGLYNDFDLAGAYTTGLVDLRQIDYENFRVSHNPREFQGHVLGFAYVRFEFPEGTRFPCLPVRNKDNGLIYPLTGFSYCTAPEIEVALNLKCHISIMYGIIIPWLDGDDRLFEPYVIRIRKLRGQFAKGSLDELYAKLLGNALYGKTAQGLKTKTVFEAKTMKSVELPHSIITNAAIAAHATGFIRAVLSEQIASIPTHRTVISATTDGFITDADEAELKMDGPMAKRFQALCERVVPGSKMLERKHKVSQLIAIKTRGQLTAMPFGDEKVVLAKAGVSVPGDYIEAAKQAGSNTPQTLPDGSDKDAIKKYQDEWMNNIHNAYMLDLFMGRQPGAKTKTFPFTPFREQWVHDSDVVRLTREITLNLEYDMKRRLIDPRVIAIPNGEHVALDSVPWNSLEECERTRAIFNGWRSNRCIKTLDDFEDWEDHYQFSLVRDRLQKSGSPGFGVRATNKGIADVFRRLFLRAYVQGLCGLTKTMTNAGLADWLTTHGYPTTTDELKNAKRAKFVEHAIPATRRVRELAKVLEAGFPSIQICKFFQPN